MVIDESVSVIIPSIGRPELVKAIISVLNQSLKPKEILIIFDGIDITGTNTHNKILELNSGLIRMFSLPKFGGPAIARNFGIYLSETKIVAFLDDDDVWLPNKLEEQMKIINTGKFILSATNAATFDDDGTQKNYFDLDKDAVINSKNLIKSNPIITSSVVARKDALIISGGFPTEKKFIGFEDYVAWVNLSFLGKFHFNYKPYLTYSKVSSNSLSSQLENKQTPVEFLVGDHVKKMFRKNLSFVFKLSVFNFLYLLWLSPKKLKNKLHFLGFDRVAK